LIGPAERAEATVITAKFSDRDILTVRAVADRLLSDCWSKACEFARNFEAPSIEIHHLLLGASHIRDAEAVLSTACDDIAELTRQLSGICAHRQFAATPQDNGSYEASQALRALLCEASALAARRNVPNLTLALILEALTETKPSPSVLNLLPKSQPHTSAESVAATGHAQALEELRTRIEHMDKMLRSDLITKSHELQEHVAKIERAIGLTVATKLAEQDTLLRQGILLLREEIRQPTPETAILRQIHELLVDQPAYDTSITGEPVGAVKLKVFTIDQLEETLRLMLPSAKIAAATATPPFNEVDSQGWFLWLRRRLGLIRAAPKHYMNDEIKGE
jgi:hypothetical protein